MQRDKEWKKKLPIEIIVFATVDFSKPKSFLEKNIADGFILKKHHNKACGLLLSRKMSWSKRMITNLKTELNNINNIIYNNKLIYTLEYIQKDPTTLILYI